MGSLFYERIVKFSTQKTVIITIIIIIIIIKIIIIIIIIISYMGFVNRFLIFTTSLKYKRKLAR